MERLRDRLQKMKGQWMLSCDDSVHCREIFAGFDFVEIPIKYASSGANGMPKPTRHELLVMSPAVAAREIKAA